MHNLHSLKRRLSDRKGFTLLELLIVLLIIGILIAIGLYKYQSVVDAARAQGVKAEVRAAFLNEQGKVSTTGEVVVGAIGDGITTATPTLPATNAQVSSTKGTVSLGGVVAGGWAVAEKDSTGKVFCMGDNGNGVTSGSTFTAAAATTTPVAPATGTCAA